MKKALIVLGIAAMMSISTTAFASDFLFEPESDTAVSYSAHDILSSKWETTFVNYAKAGGKDEYWIRESVRIVNSKLLHYMDIDIDGEKYRLDAAPFDDKHYYAVQTPLITRGGYAMRSTKIWASSFRYYTLPTELALKLVNAQKVTLYFNRVGKHGEGVINTPIEVNKEMLGDIHKAYSLRYADYSSYWNPVDRSKEKPEE